MYANYKVELFVSHLQDIVLTELMGYPNLRNFSCTPACVPQIPSYDRTSLLSIVPQDKDECALLTHECEQICADGWYHCRFVVNLF